MTWDGKERRVTPRASDDRVSVAKGKGHQHRHQLVAAMAPPLLVDRPLDPPLTRVTTRVVFLVAVVGIVVAIVLCAAAAWSVNVRITHLEEERQQRRTYVDQRLTQLQRDQEMQRKESLGRLCSVLGGLRERDELAARAYVTYCTRD